MQGLFSRLVSPLFRMFDGGEPVPEPDASLEIPDVVVPKTSAEAVASSSDVNAAEAFTGASDLSDEMETDEIVTSQAAPSPTNSIFSGFFSSSIFEYQPLQNSANLLDFKINMPLSCRLTAQSKIAKLKKKYTNVACSELGAKIVFSSNEEFEDECNLNNPLPAIDIPNQVDSLRACTSGYATFRQNVKGVKNYIIRLANPAFIKLVDIDISTFSNENSFAFASLQAAYDNGTGDLVWDTIISKTSLISKRHNFFVPASTTNRYYNLLRFTGYPEGGLSVLRVYGKFLEVSLSDLAQDCVDLTSVDTVDQTIDCSNECFGRTNGVLYPKFPQHKAEGCKTDQDSHTPKMNHIIVESNKEWSIIKLRAPGKITNINLDCTRFVYDLPPMFQLFAINSSSENPHFNSTKWTKISTGEGIAGQVNEFKINANCSNQVYSHIMVKMFPDGDIQKACATEGFMNVGVPQTSLVPRSSDSTNLDSRKRSFDEPSNAMSLDSSKTSTPCPKRTKKLLVNFL